MLKVSMLSCLIASMAVGSGINTGMLSSKLVRDAEIIVEVDRSHTTLTEEGISNTQNIVMNNIRNYVTSNFKVISRYDAVANAFAISVNSSDIDSIKKVPGVKSVTVNEMHWIQEKAVSKGTGIEDEYGDNDNVSAKTMEKGDDTNDGEGTVIAILDNEFYLKGATSDSEAWWHETFSPLDSTTIKRFNGHPDKWNKTIAYSNTKSRGEILDGDADMGKEGSLYLNSKVPFYYDYGGEKVLYADDIKDDLDVSSEISYHGSHVASIAGGNAPTYKGIAPKAQLVLMKVFTNYKPSNVAKQVGWGNSSGAYDIPIMNALNDCMKLGVDGINMSLGSNLDDFDKNSITNRTLNELAASGILTSISAGNSGKTSYATTGGYANWTKDMTETGILSGYANDPLAMTIASGQPDKIFYSAAFQMGEDIIAYDDQIVNREYLGDEYEKEYKMEDLTNPDSEIYIGKDTIDWVFVPGFGTGTDYVGLDVSGKIAVVSRGSTSFSDKYAIAKSKGAVALVVINNDPTSNDFNFHMSFGDGFRPSMPCCLVLYKDLEMFSQKRSGTINIIKKQMVENEKARTISTFSSDGATYLLDLKPEITAPGDLIRGAIPPQESDDKTPERRLRIYEYLSGTSMSAPNYAGAQSVVLSKEAKKITKNLNNKKAELAGETDQAKIKTLNQDIAQLEKDLLAYRQTVDMRLMSTANPMHDLKENPEDNTLSLTSPRKQGAGMADIGDAYRTEVYLEGYDSTGKKGINKAKIELRNNAKINSGVIDLDFMAHNEGETDRTYNVTLTVMRPAIAKANDIVTKDYNYKKEVDDIKGFPGHTYWLPPVIEGKEPTMYETTGDYADKDVYKVTRDITYFATKEAAAIGTEEAKDGLIEKGNYYYNGTTGLWEKLPDKEYQSVYDVTIATVNMGTVTANAGKVTKISLDEYTLTNEAKQEIAAFYDYGCYLEGYVTLESTDEETYPSLSIPYMGFYGGEGKDFKDAPVVEPFAFDKNVSTVYPSDLANDIAKSLLGKDKVDMGSMWVVGYVKDGQGVNVDDVLANDTNFAELSGFHNIGTDPSTGEYFSDVRNNLYVGNSYSSNTMIIQQFVLRSVADNYFTITNKETGKTVYKSSLEDMLFGSRMGVYPLYKSHVDDSYLGAGYVSHRAYAVVPLYDRATGQPFASGEYEVTFNYLLASTGEWTSTSYNLNIDSDAPEVSSITTDGDNVRINIKERNLSSLTVDKNLRDITKVVKVDEDNSYFEISKADVERIINVDNYNAAQGSGRLYVKLVDKAFGEMGVIVRFEQNDDDEILWNKYTMVEHHSLMRANDFRDDGKNITIVRYNSTTKTETEVTNLEGSVLVSRGPVKYTKTVTTGCGGNISTTSIVLSTLAFTAIILVVLSAKFRKKKVLGGND